MGQHTDEEAALFHTMLAARKLMQIGQHNSAAVLMMEGASAYRDAELSSAQVAVTGE